MANSERPQASDTPRNPIVSLRAPHCHSPTAQHTGPHRFCARPFHRLLSPLPCPMIPRMANTLRVGVLSRHVCPRRRATGRRLGRASLFAATERGFDFFEGREIFLEPINMLLHLDDG
jgi:hypothetical protein